MIKMKYILCVIFIKFILTQNNYPQIPIPGHDTISIPVPYDKGVTNSSQFPSQSSNNSTSAVMTNNTIVINMTNKDPQCTLECYTGCRVLFPEFIQQKYCIINICKCEIIENVNGLNYNFNITNVFYNATEVEEANANNKTVLLSLNKKNYHNLKNDGDNWYWIYYLILIIISFVYQYIVWNLIEIKDGITLFDWIKEKIDNIFQNNEYRKKMEYCELHINLL